MLGDIGIAEIRVFLILVWVFATDAIAPSFSIDCISEKPSLLLPIQALFHLRSPSGRTSRFGDTCGFSKDGPTSRTADNLPKV